MFLMVFILVSVNYNSPGIQTVFLFFWFSSGFQFFEASAKDNINVKQVFECLVDVICEKMNESMDGDGLVSNHKDSSLQDTSSEGHSSCAC